MVKQLLAEVTSLPTGPMHERFVAQYVEAFANKYRLNCTKDRFGNLLVTNRAPGRTRLMLMAHMDHPGLEVVGTQGKYAEVRVRGGVHRPHIKGAKFDFYRPDGSVVRGKVTKKFGEKNYLVSADEALPKKSFGAHVLPPFSLTKKRINAKVCDNLASVASILDWLRAHARKKTKVMGIFTRGEEIGWHGAWAIARRGTIPKTVPLIVLETSNMAKYPEMEGQGVVIRTGDRLHSFHPFIDVWLQTAAARLAKKDSSFKYQRALMDGGSMEASPLTLHGFLVGSLALPLGNYHNRGPQGPAREFVSWSDWQNERKLLDYLVDMPSVVSVVRERRKRLYAACMGRA